VVCKPSPEPEGVAGISVVPVTSTASRRYRAAKRPGSAVSGTPWRGGWRRRSGRTWPWWAGGSGRRGSWPGWCRTG